MAKRRIWGLFVAALIGAAISVAARAEAQRTEYAEVAPAPVSAVAAPARRQAVPAPARAVATPSQPKSLPRPTFARVRVERPPAVPAPFTRRIYLLRLALLI
jgi:hypothetical protein